MKRRPYDICNKTVIGITVLTFVVLEILGDTNNAVFVLKHGALYEPLVQQGEWYRLITACFLHFGIRHLGNNMLLLFFLGDYLERQVGHLRYVIIYLLSGVCGNLLSMAYELRTGEFAVSAGASGAIFGVMGALLYIALRNRGRGVQLNTKKLLFMALLSLYYGFTATGVNNAAHIGGLLGGILLSILLYRKTEKESLGI